MQTGIKKLTKPVSQASKKAAEPQEDESSKAGELIFLGRLFPGEGKVVFQGSFNAAEVIEAVTQAAATSTDPERVRIKLFPVDDQESLRIAVVGLRKQWGGGKPVGNGWK